MFAKKEGAHDLFITLKTKLWFSFLDNEMGKLFCFFELFDQSEINERK